MSESELEELRRKVVRKNVIMIILFVISISVISYLFLTLKDPNKRQIMILVCIAFSIMFIIIYNYLRKDYKLYCSEYKRVFVYNALKRKFSDLVYRPKSGMPKSVIWATHMLIMGDTYSSNDMISGKYKNTNFMQADVRMREEYSYVDKDGVTHSYYVDVFYGKWLVFEFNKRFKYNVQVREKGFKNAKVDSNYSEYGYEKVEMENVTFNRRFNIYTEKEHDAFYLLTPHMMERIMNLNDKIKGDMLMCFIDNELHIGLNNRSDSVEPNILKSIEKQSESINKDIYLISSFI